jgi:hypothetical protein
MIKEKVPDSGYDATPNLMTPSAFTHVSRLNLLVRGLNIFRALANNEPLNADEHN